jgi:hypothetical protein
MDTNTKLQCFIRVFIDAQRFGFIDVPDKTRAPQSYFLHGSKIISGSPEVGAAVLFNVNPVMDGKLPSAIDVEIVPTLPVEVQS